MRSAATQLTNAVRRELTLRGIRIADRFTDLEMLKLVKMYRNYSCLWNISDLYKN